VPKNELWGQQKKNNYGGEGGSKRMNPFYLSDKKDDEKGRGEVKKKGKEALPAKTITH